MKGLFITLEGPEGAGKSTQLKQLSQRFKASDIPVLTTREPGGTMIGDRIRELLLDPAISGMTLRTEILLYAASRAQLVNQVIHPALEKGITVICDRYVDSSLVYQAFGASGNLDEVLQVNKMATGGLIPDRTYLLDLPLEEGYRRLKGRGGHMDRMEMKGETFHRQVREGFLHLAHQEPDRFCLIDARLSADQVCNQMVQDLKRRFAINLR
ncbi:dTMP kinase [Melghirimyces algeriensis]|uniref:Thymidylate kinase n=1 Tax=Melghirimyces algeriensis TaxID=910412 RepID=A0A521ECX7_9BACL|nr:dTMP kinase [Melghirimyces algeriensis]SMO81783.1 dTMP kinase [Melghirimyces algeriensis]